MRLHRRIAALETAGTVTGWGPFLDSMATADLERLEGALLRLGGLPYTDASISALPDADAGFLASIIERKATACAH